MNGNNLPSAPPVKEATQFGSIEEEIQFLRVGLWAAPISFNLLGGMAFYQLHRLESHAAESVMLWGPLALVYNIVGFWPTVISPLLLSIFVWVRLAAKLRKLTSNPADELRPVS